jgi:hypothetical protein
MKKLVYTRPDGKISIVIPVAKEQIERDLGRQLSEKEYEDHVLSRSIPADVKNVKPIEDHVIPGDREFRDAWKLNGDIIDFDLEAATAIQLDRVRLARTPFLEDLDTQFMLAIELQDDVKRAAVAKEKQRLRDITNGLKALKPKNIDEVKAAFPQELKGNQKKDK